MTNATINISDVINLIGIITSILLSSISIIIAILTLKQNNKMLEETSRPYITVSFEPASSHPGILYLVLRNHGSSGAKITSFKYHPQSSDSTTNKYLNDFNGVFIAPGQKILHPISSRHFPSPDICFSFEYSNSIKSYQDEIALSTHTGSVIVSNSKDGTVERVLKEISRRLV